MPSRVRLGDRVADFPRVHLKVHVDYRSLGDSLKERVVKRAIQLSEDKYCSVGAMMKKTAKLSHSYKLQ